MSIQLTTYQEYLKLKPQEQGFVVYMEVELPGSELKEHQKCPYPLGSRERKQWEYGQQLGVQAAQDSEE